ncbi:prolyl oligopeptidase family serine peptidase [Chitinophaga polysaccharea]|uniref:S9 family peptidase n=1 Tax=Chitinophaga polysaccharea TaxID=1293035 RepID=UPI0014557C9C|nr:prolyl oligopeptidase family serine peptidase [Chitinophaga polysaccharea]NLR62298.1 prolyl oligopeptidase family serine peptidase [Chitinophaga polysaccharea]
MKYLYIVLFLLHGSNGNGQVESIWNKGNPSQAKRQTLSLSDCVNWPRVNQGRITNDGRYCGYSIEIDAARVSKLTIQSLETGWKLNGELVGSYLFTSDSRKAIWINWGDSLCIATLGTYDIQYISSVHSFLLAEGTLSCYLKTPGEKLVVIDLKSGKTRSFPVQSKYFPVGKGRMGILLRGGEQEEQSFELIDWRTNKVEIIWSGKGVNNVVVGDGGRAIAFTINRKCAAIGYYRIGMDTAKRVNLPIGSHLTLSEIVRFGNGGQELVLSVTEKDSLLANPKLTHLNLWSYVDSELQPQQLLETESRGYYAIFQFSNNKFLRLEGKNDRLFTPLFQDTVFLVRRQRLPVIGDELNWNAAGKYTWLVKSKGGPDWITLDMIAGNSMVVLSPGGKYVLFFSKEESEYFVYEVGTGEVRCVTKNIQECWEKDINTGSYGRRIGLWEKDDASVLIYGQRDIWKIDPSGSRAPVNLTNGYGGRHNVVFFLSRSDDSHRYLNRNEVIILSAFDLTTKKNGFYRKKLQGIGDPDSLIMGPYIYDITDNPSVPQRSNYPPRKALNAEKYLIRRMSVEEAPNYFITSDFKSFKQISYLAPQASCNWYTTELHTWETFGHRSLQGILYKPSNFDSTKKYPVIFYFYEKKSDALNAYLEPELLDGGCGINIPYYVSNGYLVFCPDVYFEKGDAMKETYDAILSASKYVVGLSYVDSGKIGVQGCSWGAIQINYLIAHSSVFSAACSASGIADWISNFGSVNRLGISMQGMYENGQFRVNSTLWGRPDIYIKNSPVLQADKIESPLLLMHTTNDQICSFDNIVEFVNALRRLKKIFWLLEYNGNHGLLGRDAMDFSVRMKQFFDYYLQGKDAPNWMRRD